MGSLLEAQICDVWGEPIPGGTILHTVEGGGCLVDIALNGSRLAKLTMSAYDPAQEKLKVLSRLISITYGPYLIFKGAILALKRDFAAGRVEVACHDATLRLKKHYHTYGDYAVDIGYPVDGKGMRILVESSLPTADEIVTENFPPNGILWGYDTTTHQGPRPADLKHPVAGDGIWRKVTRGENVWQSVQNLSQVKLDDDTGGPDFKFRPVDRDHLGKYGAVIEGFFCELDTADRLGTDKSGQVIFEFGTGEDNLEEFNDEPDGDAVRNWFAQVYPGGQNNRNDAERIAIARNIASIQDYGFMQGYESSGQKSDSNAVLLNKAEAWVKAYKRPPHFFSMTPRAEGTQNVPQFLRDYNVGDVIRARGHVGSGDAEMLADNIGRITAVHVKSSDQEGNVKVEIDCVPTIGDLDE